jgi:hypothetical protein
MLTFPFTAALAEAGVAVVPDPPDSLLPTDGWRLHLFALPVRFSAAGAAEGPILDLGARWWPPPLVYPVPDGAAYGPYTLFGELRNAEGLVMARSDAVGLVLRPLEKAYSVTLKRESVETGVRAVADMTGYRLRASVVEAVGLPRALFLFRKGRDGVGRPGDEFLCVAHPADFADYPENEPPEGGGKYRKAEIDIVTHHQEELEQLWTALNADVGRLVRTMESNRRLEDVRLVTH